MQFDIAIIGAGVVGTAIARDLSRFDLRVILLEARADFGDESSKGNSALMTAGFDTPRGTLERQLVTRGFIRYQTEAPAMGLPIRRVGALTLAWSDEQRAIVEHEVAGARADGFSSVTLLDGADVLRRWPHFSPGIQCAMWAPEECIADPFSTPYAYVLDAVANGVVYRPSFAVKRADRLTNGWRLEEAKGQAVTSRLVVNSGGLRADKVEGLAGYSDFVVRPRRGQYLVLDKAARSLHDVIALPTPTPTTRGILIAPTIFGNVIVGPTAEEVSDPDDRRTTPEGLAKLREAMHRMAPALEQFPVNTVFSGMRPATDRSEYQIIPRLSERWVTVAGIRSTGFSGALGIAEHVASLLVPLFVDARRKTTTNAIVVPDLAETSQRPWQDNARIEADPRYGEIICHCERVTRGEIENAMASRIPPRTLKALKRRTRAMFGRCQGFYCGARIDAIFNSGRNSEHT
ncbi:glycerol-3-phosphate dehydrogenase [Dongia mobilis]|uniref:Glycerol-3-phosphate dehydrogenase n=1 Tax=Dongia mobilis TaxID=578943 RepID=A0A4R6WPZ0_9PROT|nr:NAD(P)/FAD-dependent oxidoreductase [Dongia mobilis]TDQ78418.1 glycerol-3-phosphate dehydrogenase [Dongia mobilis]